MVKIKQTPQGGISSHRPAGMAAATFTGTGRGRGKPEEQFRDAPGEDTEDSQDIPKVQVSQRVRQVNQQHRPQKEQRPLLRKHHQIQTLLTHNPVQAKKPPKPQ